MLDYRLGAIFFMVATLCDDMDTPGMVATPIEDSWEVLFYQPLVGQILVGNIPINHLFVDLLMGALVDWTTYWPTACYGGATLVCHNSQIPKASSTPIHQLSRGST
jgi:hypothetical protein